MEMEPKQQPTTKTYRAKMVDKFIEKYFPSKELSIPTSMEIRNAIIKQAGNQPTWKR